MDSRPKTCRGARAVGWGTDTVMLRHHRRAQTGVWGRRGPTHTLPKREAGEFSKSKGDRLLQSLHSSLINASSLVSVCTGKLAERTATCSQFRIELFPRGGGCFCHGQRLCTPATVNAERFTPIDSGNIDKSLNFLIMSRDPLHCAPSLFEPGALAGRARSSILCRHAYG